METRGFCSIKCWRLPHRPWREQGMTSSQKSCSKSDGKQEACQALVTLVFRVGRIAFLKCSETLFLYCKSRENQKGLNRTGRLNPQANPLA